MPLPDDPARADDPADAPAPTRDREDDRAEWAARAASFGAVAEAYDRHRQGYPEALYADVLALGPGRRVLDAGAGTGRATLGLARAGATVHAVEPDPAMAAVLRDRAAGLPVTVQVAPFERCDPEPGGVDLVTAAQAWHWVDPGAGARTAARALAPGGVLAVWWNRPKELVGPVWDAVHDAYARYAPALDRRHEVNARGERAARTENLPGAHAAADAAPGFTPWTDVDYAWTATYTGEGYAALVATYSDHLRLPDDVRARVLAGIAAAIDDVGGGRAELPYRTILRWATPR